MDPYVSLNVQPPGKVRERTQETYAVLFPGVVGIRHNAQGMCRPEILFFQHKKTYKT